MDKCLWTLYSTSAEQYLKLRLKVTASKTSSVSTVNDLQWHKQPEWFCQTNKKKKAAASNIKPLLFAEPAVHLLLGIKHTTYSIGNHYTEIMNAPLEMMISWDYSGLWWTTPISSGIWTHMHTQASRRWATRLGKKLRCLPKNPTNALSLNEIQSANTLWRRCEHAVLPAGVMSTHVCGFHGDREGGRYKSAKPLFTAPVIKKV